MARTRSSRPDPFQSAFEAAVAEHRSGGLAGAIAAYERLLRQRPAHAGLLTNLATALKQAGRRDEALACFKRAVEVEGAPPELWFNYGNLHAELENAPGAEQAWRKALELDPKLAPAATRLANLLMAQQRPDEAIELHRRALAIAPDNLSSLRGLARLGYDRGNVEEAERLYRKAATLAPGHADTHNALGVVLKDLGRRSEAIECWQKALTLDPKHSAARNNLGVMYRLMHRRNEAVEHLRAALEITPDDSMTAANLAHAVLELGQTTEAEALARRVVERHPAHAEGHHMLGFALAYQGRIESALESFLVAHQLEPKSGAVISNVLFASLYSDQRTARDVLALHREMALKIAPAAPTRTTWRNSRDPDRRLKVGYLSPDLRSHPVSMFFEPVLERHDRNRFEVVCYSTTSAPDAVTERLRNHAAAWRDCSGLADAKIVEMIEADGIDILVDLAGHTAQNRAAVLRAKPAPVQALYIGYPGTSGLPEVDWLIADARLVPPEMEDCYSERIARLDGAFWCFREPPHAPAVSPAPAAAMSCVTFGSFNALQKATDATVNLWARVLKAVPTSRLALKSLTFADDEARRAAQRRFIDAGIEASRVEALPPTEPARFLAEYRRIDIGLDPTPYNGGTTTCEALWMGVPVVTLAGDRFCSRMGLSLLEIIGLPELVAKTPEEYVRIAAELAADLPRLKALRASLRSRMAASPVCAAPRATRELESAYRNMWAQWIAKR